jgi:MFS transporter, BCD family, chlorophyll transporter
LLQDYTPGRLIQVIQGCAVVTIVLNGIAIWQQEARDRTRAAAPRNDLPFLQAWGRLAARPGMIRLLAVIALGTAGFGMADVLLEPYGGQVLAMTVAETTRLTVVLAGGSLIGFALASWWLQNGATPIGMALLGAAVGAPAFALIILSAELASAPLLMAATLVAGFGAGLFGHGTLTASMRAAPREQIGLALGAWGAVQTTAAGLAIVCGGVIRDLVIGTHAGAATASAYIPVFALEAGLLLLALLVAMPLRKGVASAVPQPTSLATKAPQLKA